VPARAQRMRAAVLIEPGRVELREVDRPVPGPGEIVLQVDAALTCGTDLKTFRRGHPLIPLPAPLGHEFAGTVAAVGTDVARFREGDAVAGVPTAPCGECRMCQRGRDSLCPAAVGRIALGAFADYLRLPAHIVGTNLFARPADLPPEWAAALEPLACVVHGAARVRLDDVETVVLLGDGPIALLFLQLVLQRGARRVLVVGRHAARLEVARTLGAEHVLNTEPASLVDAVLAWTGGVGADLVIECVGTTETWEIAPELAASAGVVLLFGGCPAGTRACFDSYRVHYEEVELIGAFHYGRADVRAAWRLLSEGEIQIAPLITHHRPLDRFEEALDLALSRVAIKVAVHP
jgi:L-iditol 2-dehydrogenase